ncbi:MAG: hypothetical protein AAFO29_01195 [Actinomycetota bacterium]
MQRAHHQRATRIGRRHLPVVVLTVAAIVMAGCSAAEPAAEPSIRDTITSDDSDSEDNDGSVLQATVADDQGTTDEPDDQDGDGSTTTTDNGSSTTETSTTSPTDPGVCDTSAATEIRFETGGTSATISAAVSAGQQDHYELEVGDGQIMTIRVTSGDDSARAKVRAPTTASWSNDFSERVIAPTRAGFYEICVLAGQAGADYELFVAVINDTTPDRVDASWCGSTVNDRGSIQFDIGAFGSTIDGGVLRDERDLYTIEASAGQDITLFLTSLEANAVFDLRSPSGELLIDEVSDFRIPLPEDGVYQICVGSVRGNSSYTLSVDIT